MSLALATRIPHVVWEEAEDEAIATALELLDELAAARDN
jgi:hypothetical protein